MMLEKLIIKNFAIIDELEINFKSSFNIITGETGAGKSIMLGALALLLGERNDSKSHKDQSKKCIIEGQFQIKDYQLKEFFQEHDLEYDDVTILRREISSENKSRAFINDTPCTVQILKSLGEQLVDIHSQHETILLNSTAYQINLIDSVAGIKNEVNVYAKDYIKLMQMQKELEILISEFNRAAKEYDYLKFQFDELLELDLKLNEQTELEDELSLLNNADDIQQKISQVNQIISDSDQNIVEQLKYVSQTLSTLEKHNEKIKEINDRVKSSIIELKDINDELESISLMSISNPARQEIVQERLDQIYKLEQKHRVDTVVELIAIRDDLDSQLNKFNNSETEIENKRLAIQNLEKELMISAKEISKKRKSVFPLIIEYLTNNLIELGIPNAKIEIEHEENVSMNKYGIDEIRFLFSANKGQKAEYINKVASGGELSRLMLCLKALLAEKEKLASIIFDEIDTGVSGEVAIKMGQIMRKLSENLQVISITHLPQIASLGKHHYFVYKEHTEKESNTQIRELNSEERVIEIAKMLSGEKPSSGAIENAKELLDRWV